MEFKNVSWNVFQIKRMIDRGTISFDYPIQRADGQWKDKQKSGLIDSLARSYPIPAIYFVGIEEELPIKKKNKEIKVESLVVRYLIDGVQRFSTIREYLDDLFPLNEELDELIIEGETYEIAGKYYSELDEEVQQMIVSRSILTYTVDMKTTTEEEIEELYYRLNDGCPLTVQQKAKALMGVEWSTRFNELGNHRLIHEKAAFSETQLKTEGHITAIIQGMMMQDPAFDYKNVSSTIISKYASGFKSDKENKLALYEKVVTAMDYLSEVFAQKEKILLRKVHFPMMVITASQAVENKVPVNVFEGWVTSFKTAFKPKDSSIIEIPTNYVEYTGKGSTDRHKADGRMNEMLRHFNVYLEMNPFLIEDATGENSAVGVDMKGNSENGPETEKGEASV